MKELPVPAAERTIRLIELLLQTPAGLTAQDLLAQLDLSRSSLFELLRTLKALGYVEQGENRGRYLPGPRLQSWRRSGAGDSQELLKAFYYEANQSALDETLALVIPTAGGMLALAQVESSRQVRSVLQSGQLLEDGSACASLLAQPALHRQLVLLEQGIVFVNGLHVLAVQVGGAADRGHADTEQFRGSHQCLVRVAGALGFARRTRG